MYKSAREIEISRATPALCMRCDFIQQKVYDAIFVSETDQK